MNLTSPTSASISDAQGVVTILDDDPQPSLSIGDASITEGDSGTATATFTVTLSAPSGRYVSVGWETADGSATAPLDYAVAAGDLTFDLGEVSKQVAVPVVGDTLDEEDESFVVNLANPVDASFEDGQGTAFIFDDDPMVEASAADVTVCEGMLATVVLSLGTASGWAVNVDYATADGSAVEGVDYVAAIGTVTFAAGATTTTVEVPTIADWTPNCGKSFTVEFANPDNAVLLTQAATVTICDDEATCGIFTDGFETGDTSAWLVGSEP